MNQLAILTKIQSSFESTIIDQFEALWSCLEEAGLFAYEELLGQLMMELSDQISENIVREVALWKQAGIRRRAACRGMRKLQSREVSLRMQSGRQIRIPSLYARKVPGGYTGNRHLLLEEWAVIRQSSPAFYGKVSLYSVLCPSFEVAVQMLKLNGVECNTSSAQELTKQVARHCAGCEVGLSLEKQETLKGAKVVISLDGGRTRTRVYDGGVNAQGNPTFDTPWQEPRLFVIDWVDDQGQVHKDHLPIYGARFDMEQTLVLLKQYLHRLHINLADSIQIVADGAPWIWKQLEELFEELKVEPDKITLTLDYCHASAYIYRLLEKTPQYRRKEAQGLLPQLKEWLWKGKIEKIIETFSELIKRPCQETMRYLEFLSKHQEKMQYADFEDNNLMCGSGIIESAIRRIINLRFKNASTFWCRENVEGLFFLRGIILASRWNIMMKNLTKVPC